MNESVEQRHAIQKGHRPMDQMEYQGIIWVIKADADKRIAKLEAAVELARQTILGVEERTRLEFPVTLRTIDKALSEGGADECKWVEDKTDRCLWNSSCGWVFRLDTDDPPDIGWKYCPRCGKPIRTPEGGADAKKTVDDMVGMESDMNKIQGFGRRE